MIRRFIYSFSNGEYLHLGGIIRAFVMCLRGSLMSIRTRGIILLGSHSSILNPSNLEHSGFLKIENNCIIQCHSNRPIKLGREVSFGAFSQLRPSSIWRKARVWLYYWFRNNIWAIHLYWLCWRHIHRVRFHVWSTSYYYC